MMQQVSGINLITYVSPSEFLPLSEHHRTNNVMTLLVCYRNFRKIRRHVSQSSFASVWLQWCCILFLCIGSNLGH